MKTWRGHKKVLENLKEGGGGGCTPKNWNNKGA